MAPWCYFRFCLTSLRESKQSAELCKHELNDGLKEQTKYMSLCSSNLAEGWKEWIILRIQYWETHFHSHMQISGHCVLQALWTVFPFQAPRARPEFSSARVHVWVCPRDCLSIFWPAESVVPDLICYSASVRRSLEHLVTLLGRKNAKPPVSPVPLWATVVPDNESRRKVLRLKSIT